MVSNPKQDVCRVFSNLLLKIPQEKHLNKCGDRVSAVLQPPQHQQPPPPWGKKEVSAPGSFYICPLPQEPHTGRQQRHSCCVPPTLPSGLPHNVSKCIEDQQHQDHQPSHTALWLSVLSKDLLNSALQQDSRQLLT